MNDAVLPAAGAYIRTKVFTDVIAAVLEGNYLFLIMIVHMKAEGLWSVVDYYELLQRRYFVGLSFSSPVLASVSICYGYPSMHHH